jgi:hypothetical protein
MNIYHLIPFLFFFILSCENSEENSAEIDTEINSDKTEPTTEDLLTNRWVYKERVNNEGTKRIEFGDEYSERIIKLESNGHFMIYDSITNEDMILDGVPRIAKKSSGQWEVSNNKLILNHIENDSIKKEELSIDKIEKGELVTSTANRGKVTYFALD